MNIYLMILKIKTSYGWRTIDSPYDPEEEAVKSLGNSFDSQTSIILIGAGSGYFLTETLKKGINDIVLITFRGQLQNKTIVCFLIMN
jgi:hypothetical protein